MKLPPNIPAEVLSFLQQGGYNRWPERIYVLPADGRPGYKGGKGPYGFKPDEIGGYLDASFETIKTG